MKSHVWLPDCEIMNIDFLTAKPKACSFYSKLTGYKLLI